MKLVYQTSFEVSHIFAKGDIKAINTNTRCRNTTIYNYTYNDYISYYSYNTEISRRYKKNDTILLSYYNYSVTTNKHLRELKSALSHYNIIQVCEISPNKGLKENIKDYMRNIKDYTKKHLNARKLSYKSDIYFYINNMKKYIDFMKLDKRKLKRELKIINMSFNDLLEYYSEIDKHDKISRINEQKRILTKEKKELKEKKEKVKKFFIYWDVKRDYIKRLINIMRINFHRKNYNRYLNNKIFDILYTYETNFNTYYHLFNINKREKFTFNFLKLDKNIIKTNRNATITIKEGLMLHRLLSSKKSVYGLNLGGYKVISLNDKYIKIGCHDILIDEINYIANLLQLKGV